MDNKLLGLMLQGDKKIAQQVEAVNNKLTKDYPTTAEVKKLMGEGGMAVSPTVKVEKEGTVATVTITDAEGVKTFSINDGAAGPEGPKGDKGEIGPEGPKGDKGDTGEVGPSGVSVTHKWNGTTLTVTSASGTSSVDLKGDKGETGATGPEGPKGDKGDAGETGPEGDKGDKGDKGDTGATGKTAYQYAKDGGYTGSEAEFAEKLAQGSDLTYTVADNDEPLEDPEPRWMQRINEETGAEEKFYPYTHKDAVVGLNEELAGLNGILTELENNPLWGKKVSFNGDSICAGAGFTGGYGKIIAERNNMTYQNIAQGGATITAELYSSTTGNPYHWISRTISNMDANADYAIIEGGVNDAWKPAPIGTLSVGYDAPLDDSTYYGAFESMLKQLITRFAGKKIGYIAVPKMAPKYDSRNGAYDYYHIALECCEKWGVPVCDLNAGIPPISYIDELSDAYTTDGNHPNEAGYKKYYCDQIEAWMKNLTVCGRSAESAVKKHDIDTKAHKDIRQLITKLQNEKLNSNGVTVKKALLPLADGTTIEVDVLVASNGVIVIKYTNQIPLSVDSDGKTIFGSDYNGDGRNDGYTEGYRLNSSGITKATNAELGSFVTGFIPVKPGDIIHIAGFPFFRSDSSNASNGAGNYFWAYDSSFNALGAVCGNKIYYGTWLSNSSLQPICTYNIGSGEISTAEECTIKLNNTEQIAYIRISCQTTYAENTFETNGAIAVVTVNEDIV